MPSLKQPYQQDRTQSKQDTHTKPYAMSNNGRQPANSSRNTIRHPVDAPRDTRRPANFPRDIAHPANSPRDIAHPANFPHDIAHPPNPPPDITHPANPPRDNTRPNDSFNDIRHFADTHRDTRRDSELGDSPGDTRSDSELEDSPCSTRRDPDLYDIERSPYTDGYYAGYKASMNKTAGRCKEIESLLGQYKAALAHAEEEFRKREEELGEREEELEKRLYESMVALGLACSDASEPDKKAQRCLREATDACNRAEMESKKWLPESRDAVGHNSKDVLNPTPKDALHPTSKDALDSTAKNGLVPTSKNTLGPASKDALGSDQEGNQVGLNEEEERRKVREELKWYGDILKKPEKPEIIDKDKAQELAELREWKRKKDRG